MPKSMYSKEDVDNIVSNLKAEIRQAQRKIEVGHFSTYKYKEGRKHIHSSNGTYGKLKVSQSFKKAFSSVPQVFFTPIVIDIRADNGNTIRYAFEDLKVTREGFDVQIVTWENSDIWELKVKWLAIEM